MHCSNQLAEYVRSRLIRELAATVRNLGPARRWVILITGELGLNTEACRFFVH